MNTSLHNAPLTGGRSSAVCADGEMNPAEGIAAGTVPSKRAAVHRRPALSRRVAARLYAHRCDRQLAEGIIPVAGSLPAIHAQTIASRAERRAMIDSLRKIRAQATTAENSTASMLVPVNRTKIIDAAELVNRVMLRLDDSWPVTARGMALLRLLITDGTGPLFRNSTDNLAEELAIIIAAL